MWTGYEGIGCRNEYENKETLHLYLRYLWILDSTVLCWNNHIDTVDDCMYVYNFGGIFPSSIVICPNYANTQHCEPWQKSLQ